MMRYPYPSRAAPTSAAGTRVVILGISSSLRVEAIPVPSSKTGMSPSPSVDLDCTLNGMTAMRLLLSDRPTKRPDGRATPTPERTTIRSAEASPPGE